MAKQPKAFKKDDLEVINWANQHIKIMFVLKYKHSGLSEMELGRVWQDIKDGIIVAPEPPPVVEKKAIFKKEHKPKTKVIVEEKYIPQETIDAIINSEGTRADKIRALYNEGMSVTKVSLTLKVIYNQVYNVVGRMKEQEAAREMIPQPVMEVVGEVEDGNL